MAEYMGKEVFLSSMGLIGDETKYGNRDAEHQSRSYSRYMSYEIMDSVEDSIVEEELEPVRHGRWVSVPHKLARVCSVCNRDEPYKFADIDADVYDYCPNCGARMN